VPLGELDFAATLSYLMSRVGERVLVVVAGHEADVAAVAAQLAGTLVVAADDVRDAEEGTGGPVTFSFAEHDATFSVDPATFRGARASANVLVVDLGSTTLAVATPAQREEESRIKVVPAQREEQSRMKVFLSYAAVDRELADELRRRLVECGLEVWSDAEIQVGDSLSAVIAEALQTADAFVVLVTRNYSGRLWTSLEVGAALASGKPVIPVVAEPGAEVPPLLRDLKYLDITDEKTRPAAIARIRAAATGMSPRRSDEAAFEVLVGAATSLDLERRDYDATLRRRTAELSRVQVLAAAVAITAVGAALVTFSVVDSAAVTALVAGISALAASWVTFYFGSSGRSEKGP
jgi:nucleoside 2-deoxyribosyltransferase